MITSRSCDFSLLTTRAALPFRPQLPRQIRDDVRHHRDRRRVVRHLLRRDALDRVGRACGGSGSSRPSRRATSSESWPRRLTAPMSAPPPAARIAWAPSGVSRLAIDVTVRARRLRAGEAEARRIEHAAVGFEQQDVVRELGLVRVAIAVAAADAVLFVREQHDAHRAPRPQVELSSSAAALPTSRRSRRRRRSRRCPGSHESKWPPTSTISSGSSRPRQFADDVVGLARRLRSAPPSTASRGSARCGPAGAESGRRLRRGIAAAGIFGAPSA